MRSTLLAHGVILTRPAATASLTLARLVLPAHAALPVHDTMDAELLAIDRGAAVVDLTSGEGAARHEPGASLIDLDAASNGGARDRQIAAGGGVILQPEASAGVRYPGSCRSPFSS